MSFFWDFCHICMRILPQNFCKNFLEISSGVPLRISVGIPFRISPLLLSTFLPGFLQQINLDFFSELYRDYTSKFSTDFSHRSCRDSYRSFFRDFCMSSPELCLPRRFCFPNCFRCFSQPFSWDSSSKYL